MQRFAELIDQIGKALVGIRLKSALKDEIHSAIEVHAGLVKVTSLILLLPVIEAGLNLGHQDVYRRPWISLERYQVNRMFREG